MLSRLKIWVTPYKVGFLAVFLRQLAVEGESTTSSEEVGRVKIFQCHKDSVLPALVDR